jgi:ribosomal protein S18 acetylase RimI-like enzyme
VRVHGALRVCMAGQSTAAIAAYAERVAVSLRAMDAPEISKFIVASRDGYVADRVASGDDPEVAARTVDEQVAAMFPGGAPSPGHLLFCVEEDGTPVGSLWIGPPSDDRPGDWWIWDITLDESHQGRGLGRATMLLAEREARANGGTRVGLNVFGHNAVARHLYESLGYEPVAIRMSKSL